MFTTSKLSQSVRLALSVGALLSFSSTAFAAEESADSETKNVERIEVTGSRIPQSANVVSSSPISQVTAEEFKLSGTVRVEDLINDLPQVFAGQASTDSNGATGTATISLRGLGSQRTLVLINGRRMVMGSPLAGGIAADLNQIPVQLVKKVELLTGGASATYGSDAVAGVVNFIMDDEFEGVKVNYQHSFYDHHNDSGNDIAQANLDSGFPLAPSNIRDGHSNDFSIVMGGNLDGGKGNITVYATHRNIEAVTQNNRDISACALRGHAGDWSCGGSGTTPDAYVFTNDGSLDAFVDNGQFVPYDGRVYNYGPLNYFQRPDEQTTMGAFAHYTINDYLEFYSELGYMKDTSVAQIAQSGAFFVDTTFNCSNPLLTAAQYQVACADRGLGVNDSFDVTIAKRNVEGGPRQDDLQHINQRFVFGARGIINDDWNYDVSFNYGNVNMTEVYQNDMSNKAIANALNVIADPVTGQAVCAGNDPDCVPWDIYNPQNITQDQLDYLTLPLYSKGETVLREFNAYTTGDLTNYGIKTPWATLGPQVLLGYTHRSESLSFDPDKGYESGDGAGQGGPATAVDGSLTVDEYYTEVRVPLVEDVPFADNLNLDLGYRYSDYSTNINTNTYKVALGWDINSQIKLRGSYQKASRHANIRELYVSTGLALFDLDEDPCSGDTPSATLEQCARTGVTAAQYGNIMNNPAGQFNYLQGGNPDLQPERSKTVSFGFVYRPSWLDGLDFTVDYFDIDVKDAISNVPPSFIIDQCLATGDATFCDAIHRNANGSLWQGSGTSAGYVSATNINIGYEKRTGIDVNSNYVTDLPAGLGTLHLNLVGTYYDKFESQPVVGYDTIECAGKWGGDCGSPNPEWSHNLRTTWETPWLGMALSANWRHIGKVDDLNEVQNINAQNYIDLTAQFAVLEGGKITLGVNNAFDRNAPAVSSSSTGTNGNTYPSTYDALGRYVFLGVEYTF
ncbi:TonB-dependent receptor domain-containing protein [Gallaecimonas pentaromativorans]|uniref:TonB-dependent receptor-like protein n=1 Tax=Gallaecimonas pentaromativorans TaxID=584787 RepID=A0A3N1P8L7_9GAMM|nr:TonB-dependent receptor [Gallaecimonas pentaromativorans]ROQ23397.1 TonB-dependent receptor-like protein [Gallaecimonas pentaromativorans]